MRQMNLPYPQQEELYRRMVFNVMSRNHDDHSKNFSFLMDKQGKWKLSPAYDLCYSYTPGGKWTNRHQLSLNGKQDNFTIEIVFDVLVLVIGGIISLRAKDNFQKRYWGAISFCIGLVFLWENAGWLTIVSETPAYRFSDLLNMEKMLK